MTIDATRRHVAALLAAVALLAAAPASAQSAWEGHMAASRAANWAGDPALAEDEAKAAIEAVDGFDKDNPRRTIALNHLADLYRVQYDFKSARALYERVLARERKDNAKHPLYIAAALVNLAKLSCDEGKYEEAEELYRESLSIRLDVFKKRNNTLVAMGEHDLATALRAQGRYGEAEPLYRKALADIERVLGADHPRVAYMLTDLGFLYYDQERYADAEPLYRRALEIRAKKLDPFDPDVAASLGFIAFVLSAQGRHDEAAIYSHRARIAWDGTPTGLQPRTN
jgi:tetratricopeptide (TPR) repeat protein